MSVVGAHVTAGVDARASHVPADMLSSIEALSEAVRCGDWTAVEASDRALRDAVLSYAAAMRRGEVEEHRARETLVSVHAEHLRALEHARALAGDLRERLSRVGVGRRMSASYLRAGGAGD